MIREHPCRCISCSKTKAAFRGAASPETVLSLLDERDELQRQAAALDDIERLTARVAELEAPPDWRMCPHCNGVNG